jgi:hypothetical protein
MSPTVKPMLISVWTNIFPPLWNAPHDASIYKSSLPVMSLFSINSYLHSICLPMWAVLFLKSTSSTGSGNMVPFNILLTVPSFSSRSKISFGPRNAMFEGFCKPLKTSCMSKLGSLAVDAFLFLELVVHHLR